MRALAYRALAATLIAGSAIASTQAQTAKAFLCVFPGGNVSTFDSKWQTGSIGEGMQLTFVAFDRIKAKAQVLGVLGSSEVLMAWGEHSVNFVETLSTGDLTLTTIFLGKSGPLPATHSRHIVASGEPVVSQLNGTCEARN